MIKTKYSALFDDLRIIPNSTYYPLVFMTVRGISIISYVFGTEYPLFQALAIFYFIFYEFGYLVAVRPYKLKS